MRETAVGVVVFEGSYDDAEYFRKSNEDLAFHDLFLVIT